MTVTPPADPPLGACPTWCEKPADHGWEDEWSDGPMRDHVCTIDRIDRYNAIRLHEYERYTRSGRVRERAINLDLDQSENWDAAGAQRVIDALNEAVSKFAEPVRE
jgi:hypothetical protein